MSSHALEIVSEQGELSLRLVCHAVPGATCRKRPADRDVEEWSDEYDGEVVDGECWAVEWASQAGFDDAVRFDGEEIVTAVPVTVTYDEGVTIRKVVPHTALSIPTDPALDTGCDGCE